MVASPISRARALVSRVRRVRRAAAVVAGVVAGAAVVASPAAAHTGLPAGGAVDGVLHPFTGLDHLLAMVAVGVVAACAGGGRIAWLAPAGFVTGMVAGGIAGMAGAEVPYVEVAVTGSVVLLGVWIMTAAHVPGRWVVVPALMIGAVHGLAHGAELPLGATPIAYLAGFVAATILLHLAGVGAGLGLSRLPSVRAGAGALVTSAGVLAFLAL